MKLRMEIKFYTNSDYIIIGYMNGLIAIVGISISYKKRLYLDYSEYWNSKAFTEIPSSEVYKNLSDNKVITDKLNAILNL